MAARAGKDLGGREEEEGDGEDDDDSFDGRHLGATLDGDALARSLVDTQTANELGLVRSEVRRLRAKIANLEREKDDMAEDFSCTTKALIGRIKELEAELSESQSRPQTAAVLERVEGASGRRPPLPGSAGSNDGGARHAPEVVRIEENPPAQQTDRADVSEGRARPAGETDATVCGNCRRSIPGCSLIAHSVHCYRINFRCDACDEVLLLRDKEQHLRHWTDPERFVDAAGRRDIETLQRMLGHDADVCGAVHPRTRDTAMHAAARAVDKQLVELFVAHGVEVKTVNEKGETPLHLAAAGLAPTGEEAEVVEAALRLLVELGSDLNALDGRGESPLMVVCRRGAARVAQYLVEQRADAELCTRLGDTPLQIAQRHGHQETVLALCTAGASLRSGTPGHAERPAEGQAAERAAGGAGRRRARSGSPMPGARGRERAPQAPHGSPGQPPTAPNAAPGGGYPPRPRLASSRRSTSTRGSTVAAAALVGAPPAGTAPGGPREP